MDLKVRATSEYKNISLEETYKFLETTAEGLSDSEVKIRLEKFGNNEIIEKQQNTFLEFILRYWGPMPWLLELATVSYTHLRAHETVLDLVCRLLLEKKKK